MLTHSGETFFISLTWKRWPYELNTDFFFFYLGFMARQDSFIHFEQSQSLGGRIWRSPGMKKTHDDPQAELDLSQM